MLVACGFSLLRSVALELGLRTTNRNVVVGEDTGYGRVILKSQSTEEWAGSTHFLTGTSV